MHRFILVLDSGTSSCRAVLFSRDGQIVGRAQKALKSSYPAPGWVEQEADDIWATTLSVAVEAMSRVGASASDILGIGIANQRETTIIWDKASGQPLAPAIVWQCRRTAPLVDRLRREGLEDDIRARTGLVLDPYFSATKIMWLLDQSPALRARAEKGQVLFGTVDAWLIYKLTGGKRHVTDVTNAARIQLFNIHTMQWDESILSRLNIPAPMLPALVPSAAHIADSDPSFFAQPLPIMVVIGDQQPALIGQHGFSSGDAKCTFGTGCFLLMNTGTVPVLSRHGLLTTIAYGLDNTVRYALEGSVFTAGQAISWLKDELGFLRSEAESESIAETVADTNGVYLVPAISGLGAPYWNPRALGTMVGLTAGTTKAHIVRATVESLAYQTVDVLHAMKADSGLAVASLHADGGASRNNLLMQTLADLHDDAVRRPDEIEATARGAALLAGVALGIFTLKSLPAEKTSQVFLPQLKDRERQSRLDGWRRSVDATLAFCKD